MGADITSDKGGTRNPYRSLGRSGIRASRPQRSLAHGAGQDTEMQMQPMRRNDEQGFSLVEATIAMALVALLIVGLSASLLVAIRQQRDIRQRQQATAIALDHVEFARSLSWTQLELSSAPDATIPHHAALRIDGTYFEIGADEPLVIDSGVYTAEDPDPGLIDPGYSTTEIVNGVPFEVYQYVTLVEPGLRRVTVLVEWDDGQRTYVGMTQISTLGAG